MLELEIAPDAQAYIAARGQAVTLRYARRNGCCGGVALLPVVELGAPAPEAAYQHVAQAGVAVYLEPQLASQVASQEVVLSLELEGLWRWQRLVLHGAPLALA